MHLLRCHVTDRMAGDTALAACLQRIVPTTVCTSPFLKSLGWLSLTAELQCSSSTPAHVTLVLSASACSAIARSSAQWPDRIVQCLHCLPPDPSVAYTRDLML